MRHPTHLPHVQHLFRLLLGAALATAGIAVASVAITSGSAPACTVEYTTAGQWEGGFQGSVTLTNPSAP